MSNHHLRNRALSLKAKGLLSQMLSLPEDWDYTLQGLARINRESIDAIRQAIRELEQAVEVQVKEVCVCEAMKPPVGTLTTERSCVSKMEGLSPDKFRFGKRVI